MVSLATYKLCIKRLIKPQRFVSIYRYIKYNRSYAKKSVRIGFDTLIHSTQIDEYVSVGDNCNIKDSVIGRHTYIGANSIISNAIVGSFCSISFNVTLGLSKHPSSMVSSHPAFYSNTKGFKTFADRNYFEEYGTLMVGNDVLIGKNVVVLYGVKIGNGAIITNNAVVTKDVPPYAIVGGIPAQIIKYRFDEPTRSIINNSAWWDWDEKKLSECFKKFHSITDFCNILR